MLQENDFEKYHRMMEQMAELLEWYTEYKKLRARFIPEITDTVSRLLYEHFTGDLPHPDISAITSTSLEEIREILADSINFYYQSVWALEDIMRCVELFREEENPAEWRSRLTKFRYPHHTEETIQEEVERMISYAPEKFTEEDIAYLRQLVREDGIIDDYYAEFRKKIHNTLKKMALDYMPDLMEITGNGFRELDSALYIHARELNEECMVVLEQVQGETDLWRYR